MSYEIKQRGYDLYPSGSVEELSCVYRHCSVAIGMCSFFLSFSLRVWCSLRERKTMLVVLGLNCDPALMGP